MLRPYHARAHAITAAKQNVRVPDVRFPEHAAPAVARAFRLGARGSFEIVHEPAHDALLHQPRRPRRPGVSGSSKIDRRTSNSVSPTLPASGELPWSTVFPDSACSSGSTTAASPAGVNTTGSAPSGGVTTVSAAASRVSIERTSVSRSASPGMSAPTY